MQLLDMAVSPDHRFVAFTDWSMSIHLYSLATFEKITSLKGHAKAVSTLRFSETEPWLFSGSHDGTVRIWDLQSFAELACYQGSRPNDED
jgi:WD40 repeat protein